MTEQAQEAVSKTAQLSVLSQYVRNVSFDNIAATQERTPSGKPNIKVQVNVDAKPIGDGRFAVALKTNVDASSEENKVFDMKLDYVGIFQLRNVPEKAMQPVLLIECPRLLFPFARRVVAELTRDGGYPPLMLDPIDFAALYRRQLADAATTAAASAPQ